jgi:acetolactate synthase-1/2/3 large subunit
MQVGERLAQILVDNGVHHVFGVPGGQTLPIYEGISKFQGIEHVLMRDERSAGFAADAYARITGRTGVCDATVGPGATNFTSPLAEAYCSSIPLIAIVADISRAWEHRRTRGNASQAMEQMEMFGPVSKWQVQVNDPRALDNVMDSAFRVATTGKPGPVVVCLPDDVTASDFSFRDPVKGRDGAIYPSLRSAPDPDDIKKAAQSLADASKPIIIVGGGAHISGCYDQLKTLVEMLKCPVVSSISGIGIIDLEHPQALGTIGTFGNPGARDAVQAAELVLFVGCKAGQLTTFSYRCPAKDTPVIHLENDPEEIGRNFPNTLPLLGDARVGLEALIAELEGAKPKASWDFDSCKAGRQQWYQETTGPAHAKDEPLKPPALMDVVNKHLTAEDLVVCDASLSSGWAASYLNFKGVGRRCIAPRGLAGLGWGSPAAIGAAIALDKPKRVIQFVGDGAFGYSVSDLEVMVRLNLPVVTILLNNDILGWIKHIQRDHYAENYVSTDFAHVDFATVARGFGTRDYTVRTLDEFDQCLAKEASPEGPAVIDVISDPWASPILPLK